MWGKIKKGFVWIIGILGVVFGFLLGRKGSDRRGVEQGEASLRRIEENGRRTTELNEREKGRIEQERSDLERERGELGEERTSVERERERLGREGEIAKRRQRATETLGEIIETVEKRS